ncbi:MAG: type II secretion system GspH family protein [Acidobacteria bacterium]|jgi:prepilin-type N-terminal cleavage/methylation domain-containing protein|nr:type II secretion system GspH family protein [Acidobacteriota bacterium]
MSQKGFTLTETLIAVMLVGILSAVTVPLVPAVQSAASTARCMANMENFASEIQTLAIDGHIPTQDEVREHIDWEGKYKDYWYIPNNSDFNKGHGNDLDGCDEENPGQSMANRECIPMRFLIICRHEFHGSESDAKYCFKTDFLVPQIVPWNEVPHTYLKDANWWLGDDPGFQKWIGRTPKK